MPKDRLDRVEEILDKVGKRLDRVGKRLDRVGKRLDALAKEQKEFAKEYKEFHREFAKEQKKTDEQIKELGKKQEKTDEQIKELGRKQEKTDEQLKKTDKEIDKVVRDIGGGLGRMAEGLTAPCVPLLFKQYGMNITGIHQRVKALDDGKVIAEVDIIGVGMLNGKRLFLVGEVKGHLTSYDVKYFKEEVLPYFREYYSKDFNELKDKETYVYGFASGMFIDEATKRFAYREGLFILEPKGETMHITNPLTFKPKLW